MRYRDLLNEFFSGVPLLGSGSRQVVFLDRRQATRLNRRLKKKGFTIRATPTDYFDDKEHFEIPMPPLPEKQVSAREFLKAHPEAILYRHISGSHFAASREWRGLWHAWNIRHGHATFEEVLEAEERTRVLLAAGVDPDAVLMGRNLSDGATMACWLWPSMNCRKILHDS